MNGVVFHCIDTYRLCAKSTSRNDFNAIVTSDIVGYKSWGGGQEVAISDTGDYGYLKENSFLPLNSLKSEIFGPTFCIFGRKFSDNKNIVRQAII